MSVTGISIDIKPFEETVGKTELAEEYGLQSPDGRITWRTIWAGNEKIEVQHITVNSAKRSTLVNHLRDRAKQVGISPHEYICAHKIVKRQVVVVVGTPEVHGELDDGN